MKKRMKKLLPVACFLLLPLAHPVSAEESALPVEPQITIRHEDKKTMYEYRVNGILMEIKVVPEIGPAYYLVPADGGGWIKEEQSQLLVPKWVIFSW